MERLIKIHTLGPKETDSCSAAYYFSQQRTGDGDISIILHDSFEKFSDIWPNIVMIYYFCRSLSSQKKSTPIGLIFIIVF
ncbi:hypothetical protein OENI_80010 [Oenococcus oeni]|nr:hypothetical protein OENI_80010 [Oenococcus oeni]